MNRRRFLQSAAVAALAAPLARARAPRKEAVLNLGSQEGRLPGASLKEKAANLVAWGGVGLELGGNPKGRIQEIRDAILSGLLGDPNSEVYRNAPSLLKK